MMLLYKVLPCPKLYFHDAGTCEFAHVNNYRRNLMLYSYDPMYCANMKKFRRCIHGDECRHAHGVHEVLLHPMRYKTELCRDGPNCKRKICYFAHGAHELRLPCSIPVFIQSSLDEKLRDVAFST
jgi:hypothetical protein